MVYCKYCSEYVHGRRMKDLHNGRARPWDFERDVEIIVKRGVQKTKKRIRIRATKFMVRIYENRCPNYLK